MKKFDKLDKIKMARRVALTLAALCALVMFAACKHPTNDGGSGAPEKKMVRIVKGSFEMGSTDSNADSDEQPVHTVILTKDFLMSNHEVTQDEWVAVFGAENNPSDCTGDDLPVENVNWYMAIAYCNKLSIKEGLTPCYSVKKSGSEIEWVSLKFEDIPTSIDNDWNTTVCDFTKNGYRLPTEAEWEYAARGTLTDTDKRVWAGTTTKAKVSYYIWTEVAQPYPVMTKRPNSNGLYDMSGNVSEWCWDWYGDYPTTDITDPKGAGSSSAKHVRRGGSAYDTVDACAVSVRDYYYSQPEFRNGACGFRVVRTVTE